jgi:hypothetical protein
VEGIAGLLARLLTVEVMSAEQTSQMYFRPPSVPRVAVFFRMTPIGTMSLVYPVSRAHRFRLYALFSEFYEMK